MTATLRDANGNVPIIRRGESVTWTFHVIDYDQTPPGDKNLAGSTENTLIISADRSQTAIDLTLTLGSGVSNDGVDGNITVVLTKEQTKSLPTGRRWIELWVTDAFGAREAVGEGHTLIYDTVLEEAV